MKQKTYLDKLIEKNPFIAMILRTITLAIEDEKELEDIIKDIERVIETHRMVNS